MSEIDMTPAALSKLLKLHDMIIRNDCKPAAELLKSGIDVNTLMVFKQSKKDDGTGSKGGDILAYPLHVACIYRRPMMVELLLKHGADPDRLDRFNRSPLELALTYWPRIQPNNDVFPSDTPEQQVYATYLSAQHDACRRCVELLKEHGANTNIKMGTNREDIAHLIARFNLAGAVPLVASFGVNFDERDIYGRTPLILAAKLGNFAVVRAICEQGVNYNAVDVDGRTALHYACAEDKSSNGHFTKLLLNKSSNIDARDCDGNTPLHMAAFQGRESSMAALISAGADLDASNMAGHIPLYMYLNNEQNVNHPVGLSMLVNNTVQINVRDNRGKMPLSLLHPDMAGLHKELIAANDTVASLERRCRLLIRRTLVRAGKKMNQDTVSQLPCAPGIIQMILCNSPCLHRNFNSLQV